MSSSANLTLPVSAFVLDFDGVVVESAEVKARAFRVLFEGFPNQVDAIVQYHLAHEGVSRYRKFHWIYSHLLGQTLDDATLQRLDARFSALVVDEVLASPWVPGAEDFLRTYHDRVPLFVASGTPEREIRDIVRKRGLDRLFAGVFGSPPDKERIAKTILLDGFRAEECFFVGDAMADLEGAAAAGMHFIGRARLGGAVFPSQRTLLVVQDLRDLAAHLCFAGSRLFLTVGDGIRRSGSVV